MATKSTTHEAGKAAQLAKQRESSAQSKGAQNKAKKKVFDPRRKASSYSDDEIVQMVVNGEINTPNFSDENLTKFVLGKITWAELTGLTMQDAYAFA